MLLEMFLELKNFVNFTIDEFDSIINEVLSSKNEQRLLNKKVE